jgi:2-succinyl-6-hydroxy-2,4-cyclohexadiene-1-carboxylate synthase
MGGRLALFLAIHYGHLCTSLIIESATPGIRGDDERVRRKEIDEKRAEELQQGKFEDFLQKWYSQPIFRSLAEAPEKLDKILKKRSLNEPEELAKALRGMSVGVQDPLWKHLCDIDIPVLLVTGERDRKYVDIVSTMAELLPHAAAEIVPGAGHNVHVENPSVVAERIKRFLGGSLGF